MLSVRHLTTAGITSLLTLICSTPLQAVIETSAGGIQFMKSQAIAIERQDISISLDKVVVSNVFKNTSALPLIETMVFAVPPQTKLGDLGSETVNHYKASVNGRPVLFKTDIRAVDQYGHDISAFLKRLNLPLAPKAAIARLKTEPDQQEKRSILQSKGLLDETTGQATWQSNVFHHWQQSFPVAEEVHIQQSYKPSVITSTGKLASANSNPPKESIKKTKKFLNSILDTLKGSARDLKPIALESKQNVQLQSKYGNHLEQFCNHQSSYEKLMESLRQSNFDNSSVIFRELNYSLTKDGQWSGPIRHFTLKIKHPQQMKPVLCWPLKFERISATTLLYEAEDFMPQQDLGVLMVETTQS